VPNEQHRTSISTIWQTPVESELAWKPGANIRNLNCNSAPGFGGTKEQGQAALKTVGLELAELQEKLFATGKSGGDQSVLLVIQGLDTAGKGGVVKHVMGQVDPQGISLASFGVPTKEESEHHYLWRVEKALPKPGYIGVFDRSHWEQVLVVRVEGLAPESQWRNYYQEMNTFEESLRANGTKIVKVALIVSKKEQQRRLAARLDHPNKYWKYNPNDLKTRAKFDDYLDAYQEMLDKSSTSIAPWYVIPADKKWYVRLAITQLLVDTLRAMHLEWPAANFDVEEQKKLVAAS
jgi:PPK2 family polyphosphate:nucleotide phosphotransferase